MSARSEPWMDDLEAQLSAAAVRAGKRLRVRRYSRRIAAIAVAVALVLGSAALAQTTTFHPIDSFQGLLGAQRATTRADALPPAFRAKLEHAQFRFARLDEFRLMATVAGGRRIYAAPGRGGTLCLIVMEVASGGVAACGPRLGPSVPLTAVTETAHAGAGPVFAGLARDDVKSILITVRGVPQRIPVNDNAFFYKGEPLTGISRPYIVELRDGTSFTYPR